MFRWLGLPALAGLSMLLAQPGCGLGEQSPQRAAASPAPSEVAPTNEAASGAEHAASPERAPPSKPARELDRAPLVSVRRELMGTWFELKVATSREAQVVPLLERGVAEIARLEELLSEWRPSSEISQITTRAGDGALVPLSPDTLACLRVGLDVARVSDGAFDPTWAAMRGLYRFDPGGERIIPRPQDVERARTLVDYRGLELKDEPPAARLTRRGMAVGTGGIAKGYALDRVGELLQQAGFADYLLFAGGQVQVHGKRGDRPWRIGIQHPRSPHEHVGFIELGEGSVSTSGDYEHYFLFEGRRLHHIIDPRTGWPASRSIAVTLIAPKGVAADALSTACFIKGPEACFAMLAKLPEPVHAVVIDPALRVHISPGFAERVVFTPPLREGGLLHPPSGSSQ